MSSGEVAEADTRAENGKQFAGCQPASLKAPGSNGAATEDWRIEGKGSEKWGRATQ